MRLRRFTRATSDYPQGGQNKAQETRQGARARRKIKAEYISGNYVAKLGREVKRGPTTWGREADENVEAVDQDVGPGTASR